MSDSCENNENPSMISAPLSQLPLKEQAIRAHIQWISQHKSLHSSMAQPISMIGYISRVQAIALFLSTISCAMGWTMEAFSSGRSLGPLYHSPKNAPKHDVGENPMADFTPEQLERAQAYMEHQNNVPKLGFPTDVRSLVQYNHGFAVMSTNSKA